MKFVIFSTLTTLFLLLSCSTPSSKTTPEKTPLVATGSAVKASEKSDWQKTLDSSKKEDRLVVWFAAGGEARVILINAFKEKFGIMPEIISAGGSQLSAKILNERKAMIYTGDVYIGGGTSQMANLKPAGALDPLEPALILPEVKDPDQWWGGKHPWIDPDHTVLSFTLYPGTTYAINTEMVKPEEVKSYKDLLNPKWKGKMVLYDPTVAGGPTQKWFVAIAFGALPLGFMPGMDFMKELAKQEPIILRDRRQQVEWLAHGRYPIALAPDTTPMTEFKTAGSPIAYVNPVEGNFLTSGYGNVSLVNKAPHPYTARVFINWLLTKEGQLAFTRGLPYHSARLDVPTDQIEPSKMRTPGVKYFYTETEEYLLLENERGKTAKDIFAALLK